MIPRDPNRMADRGLLEPKAPLTWLKKINPMWKMAGIGKRDFFAKVPIYVETKRFIVKTVNSRYELDLVRKLRFLVFQREYAGKAFPFGSDRDRYDFESDILVVIDRSIGKIVGTYRLICSSFSEEFYSASEFDIGDFLASPGVKLEMSRACIHRKYRKGSVMSLLWKGVADYFKTVEAAYLFGCSSVRTTEMEGIFRVSQALERSGAVENSFAIQAKTPYRIDAFASEYERFKKDHPPAPEGAKAPEIPKLFRSYLRAGARVHGDPAIDTAFRCTDFFTILELDKLNATYGKKYVE